MSNTVIMTQMSQDDLKALIREAIREIIPKQTPSKAKEIDEYLTRDEAATHLKISIATLDRHKKEGTLKFHRVGRKVLFKKHELSNSLKTIN